MSPSRSQKVCPPRQGAHARRLSRKTSLAEGPPQADVFLFPFVSQVKSCQGQGSRNTSGGQDSVETMGSGAGCSG